MLVGNKYNIMVLGQESHLYHKCIRIAFQEKILHSLVKK